MQDDSSTVTKILLFIGGIVTAALATVTKIFIDRRRTNAEAKSISTTSDKTVHDMHQSDAREYRELFKQAELEIRKSRRHWMNAEFFIREMLFKMKTHNIPGWEEDEARFNAMVEEVTG